MKILNIEQGTPAWKKARLAKVTGSRVSQMMGTSESQLTLIAELIAEEATEMPKTIKQTSAMERGNIEEEFAKKRYADTYGEIVESLGFIDNGWKGLSPDGIIRNADGEIVEALEVKSPETSTYFKYKILNEVPLQELGLIGAKGQPLASAPFLGIPTLYKWQCLWYFVNIPTLEKLHFVTYDERIIDEDKKLSVVTIERKNELVQDEIKKMEVQGELFLAKWKRWKEIVLPNNF